MKNKAEEYISENKILKNGKYYLLYDHAVEAINMALFQITWDLIDESEISTYNKAELRRQIIKMSVIGECNCYTK